MPSLYGLIGYPLTHSFSPAYFKKKFADQLIDAVYEPFPLTGIEQFPGLLAAHPELAGLNVTIPYKESIIPYLDEVSQVVSEICAVNCICFKNGHTTGFNTDTIGFERSLIPLLQSQHTDALVLGTGGSSKAVAYVLRQLGISYNFVSRSAKEGCLAYSDLNAEIINGHKLIINTTPLGMYPAIDAIAPIPFDAVGQQHLLYDLIYNPDETRFLQQGAMKGAAIKNGFEMLQLQAEAAWDIWSRINGVNVTPE
jgi:shikimate dehydrogenase